MYLAGVDAFDEGAGSVGSAYGGAEYSVDVDVIECNLAGFRRRSIRMIPSDQY